MSSEKTTWEKRAVVAIAKEMMKGLNPKRFKTASPQDIEDFVERYRDLIEAVIPHVPRGLPTVGAVICKCGLKYDLARAIEFLVNFRDSYFNGRDDPVFLYCRWFYSKNRIKQNRILTYQKTLNACRAYCEYRKLKEIRATNATVDVFEWDDDWTYQDSKKKSSSKEEINSNVTPVQSR